MIDCIEDLFMSMMCRVYGICEKIKKNIEGKRTAAADLSGMRFECVGTIEIVLILVVLIGLVLIFKNQIRDLLSGVFTEINAQSTEIY